MIPPANVVAALIMQDLHNSDPHSMDAMTAIVQRVLDAVRLGQVTITPNTAVVTCGPPTTIVPVVGGIGTIA